MPKIRIGALADELDADVDNLVSLAKSKLCSSMITGKGGKALWINEDGQEILRMAVDIPEIVPKHYKGYVIKSAANPRYIYALIKEIDKKVPVCVPRKLRKALVGKNIKIEAIEDEVGVSYRYVR
tara:strand:- start:2967 stop:3341 length:375 start_codon:yes stop_codon:yes gene_type:complete